VYYHIRVKGHLASSWEPWFAPLQLQNEASGTTVLAGPLPDQAALYGVLLKLDRLGLTLLSLESSETLHQARDTSEKTTGKVVLAMSLSLDGFIAGPNVAAEQPLGQGAERLHDWMFLGKTERQAAAFEEESFKTIGAIIMGRRTFDVGVAPWGDNPTFHAPCFVLSAAAQDKIVKQGGTTYTFVTDGIESALAQARAAAAGKNVQLLGGANAAQQYLKAGLVDELQIHLVPILLGEGIRLFEHLGTKQIVLQQTGVSQSAGVTHLTFRVVT
jgi:dihydrofolate reductase